jgi:hypothetical protein
LFLRSTFVGICICAVGMPAGAQITPVTYHVSGTVSDGGGNPIDKAEVTLSAENRAVLQSVTTMVDGRFSIGNLSAGNGILHVRRLGYQEFDERVTIGADGKSSVVDVQLREVPQKLEEVLVKSDEEGRLREFAEHKNQRSNFGRYFDRGEIRKRNPAFASELFRTIPGAQVQTSPSGGNTVRIRGCRPLVWIDGQRVGNAELDELVRPSEIAGLEIYPSNAGIPPEYMDRNNGACGIIVVWTKSQ